MRAIPFISPPPKKHKRCLDIEDLPAIAERSKSRSRFLHFLNCFFHAVFHSVSLSIHGTTAPETDAGCSPEPSVSHCSLLVLSQHIAALPLEGNPHPLRRRKSEVRCSFAKWHEPHLLHDPAIWESRDFADQ